jgi:hypothetical protein
MERRLGAMGMRMRAVVTRVHQHRAMRMRAVVTDSVRWGWMATTRFYLRLIPHVPYHVYLSCFLITNW